MIQKTTKGIEGCMEEWPITYRGRLLITVSAQLTETLKARRAWKDILKNVNNHTVNCLLHSMHILAVTNSLRPTQEEGNHVIHQKSRQQVSASDIMLIGGESTITNLLNQNNL